MPAISSIVILTGAGVSAESGLRTFRADEGLWEDHPIEDVATPEGFARDPVLVQEFYNERRAKVLAAKPNAAHIALGQLLNEWHGDILLVTQNIDDLHERGGAEHVVHMHGEVLKIWCVRCNSRHRWTQALESTLPCPSCRATGMRPDIVWFGEMPYHMDRIFHALAQCDLFVSIGTSGAVYPAAGFVTQARGAGAQTLELNLELSQGSSLFDETRLGKASALVPQWVDAMLMGQ